MFVFVQITMPSGTYVTVGFGCTSPTDCCLDIAVYPLAEDSGLTEGLCGNNNDDDADDWIPRGSNSSTSELFEFVKSYL